MEGARRGAAQLDRIGSSWTLEYDRHEDTLFLRKPGHGPAVSYFLPGQTEVYFELDGQGDLVGVDLTDFRRVLVKAYPQLRFVRRALWLHWLGSRVPSVRTIAEWFRDDSLPSRARDEVNAMVTGHLCAT